MDEKVIKGLLQKQSSADVAKLLDKVVAREFSVFGDNVTEEEKKDLSFRVVVLKDTPTGKNYSCIVRGSEVSMLDVFFELKDSKDDVPNITLRDDMVENYEQLFTTNFILSGLDVKLCYDFMDKEKLLKSQQEFSFHKKMHEIYNEYQEQLFLMSRCLDKDSSWVLRLNVVRSLEGVTAEFSELWCKHFNIDKGAY